MLATSYSLCAQEAWDLRKCVEYAMANNISVKQADLQTRFSKLQLTQSKWAQYPTANVQASTGFSFGLSENPTTGTLQSQNFLNSQIGLSANVTLFNWFSRRLNIEAADLNLQADQAAVRKAQNDVALNVAVAYLNTLLAKKSVAINEAVIGQTRSQLEATRRRVEAGALPELNALQLEAQLALDSSALITAQTNGQQQLLLLRALLNIDPAQPFDIAEPPVGMIPVEPMAELMPELVYASAVKNLPQQQVFDLRIQSLRKSVSAARANMYPTISAFGGLNSRFVNIESVQSSVFNPSKATGATVVVNGTTYSVVAPGIDILSRGVTPYFTQLGNNFGQNIGIGFTVPILNGRQLRSNWERSQLNVLSAQLQLDQSNLTLKQDIYTAYNTAVASLQKFEASRRAREAAARAYDFALQREKLGLLSVYDLIQTQTALSRANTDMLLAQFDYVFRMKLLEFYKGQGLKL